MFCPKCGTILIPTKVNRTAFLSCPRCGFKSKARKNPEYRISEKGKEKQDVAIIIDKNKKQKKLNQKEYEIEPPEYEEEMYE